MIVEKFWMVLPETEFDRNGNLPRHLAPRFIFMAQDAAEIEAEKHALKHGVPVYLLEATRAFVPAQVGFGSNAVSVPRWIDQLPVPLGTYV